MLTREVPMSTYLGDTFYSLFGGGIYGLVTLETGKIWINYEKCQRYAWNKFGGTIFILCHEMCHVLVDQDGIDISEEEEEEICDQVAEYVCRHIQGHAALHNINQALREVYRENKSE